MLLAFTHIEKTGGTTLNQILRRNFLFRFVDVRPLSRESAGGFTAADLKKYRAINPFLTAISGHAIRPSHVADPLWAGVKRLTLLRDPAERYVSQYLYFVRIGERRSEFERFMEQEEFANFQTKKLAGNDDVDVAIANLEAMFVSGAVEEFDAFLMRLRSSLRPLAFDPRYFVKNAGNSMDSGELLNRFRSEIEERNSKDRVLYRHLVDSVIPRANANYDGDLGKDLVEFSQLNAGFRPGLLDYVDFATRKLYYQPISGFVRQTHGLPATGSY